MLTRSGDLTLVLGDMISGERTLGRLDRLPGYQPNDSGADNLKREVEAVFNDGPLLQLFPLDEKRFNSAKYRHDDRLLCV